MKSGPLASSRLSASKMLAVPITKEHFKSDNDRPTGVTFIAAFFIITAIPSFIGTVYFIIDSLDVVLSNGFGEGLLVNFWAQLLGIVATLFYGVLSSATGYGLWFKKDGLALLPSSCRYFFSLRFRWER
jgi:hypothetical protein